MGSEDRLSISFERQEVVEDGEEEEIKEEEEEEEEEEEKSEKVVQLWSPEKFQRDYTTSDPSATCGLSRKVTGPEGHTNDRTSTFGPPRNPTDPSTSGVTAEPIDPNRCLRPLQRARERRAARLKEGSHANAEFGNELLVDPDPRSCEFLPHVPAVKRWKPPDDTCFVCDEVAADVDWYQPDWDEDIAICMPCIDKTEKGRSFLQFCISKFGARQNSQ